MKKHLKILSLVIVAVMLLGVIEGCASPEAAKAPADTAAAATPAAQPGTTAKTEATAAPEAAVSGNVALDTLLSYQDKLPLSGVQPSHLESRESVGKALPIQPKENLVIGWTAASLGSSFFTGMRDAAQAACDKYGYTLNLQSADFDLNKQFTQIDTFITQGVDVLVVNTVDMDAGLEYYKKAVAAGIPVFCTGPTAAQPEYPIVTTLLSGSFESGYQIGLYVAEKLYTPGRQSLKVGGVHMGMGVADTNSRSCGWISGYLYKAAEMNGTPYASKWDAVLDGYKYWIDFRDKGSAKAGDFIDLVGMGIAPNNNTDAASGQQAASDLLTAHPDMDVIMVDTDSMSPGVIQEVKQHNLVPGQDVLITCGADGTKYAMDYIKRGELFAVATNVPYYNGNTIIDIIHAMYSEGYDANNLPANLFTPTYAITAENIDQYYDANSEFAKAAPFNYVTIDEYNAANAG